MAGVGLTGLPELLTALEAVKAVLSDPATVEAGTQLLAAGARPFIPTDTGKLPASEQVIASGTGAQLVYAVPYSVFVQASQPWLGQGITAAVDQLVELYATGTVQAWQTPAPA